MLLVLEHVTCVPAGCVLDISSAFTATAVGFAVGTVLMLFMQRAGLLQAQVMLCCYESVSMPGLEIQPRCCASVNASIHASLAYVDLFDFHGFCQVLLLASCKIARLLVDPHKLAILHSSLLLPCFCKHVCVHISLRSHRLEC